VSGTFIPPMISYDIEPCPLLESTLKMAKDEGINFRFQQANVLDINIEETDFLFIDTLHIYDQLSRELALHSPKVRKYIGLHDTEFFANKGEVYGMEGLQRAIDEFIENNREWHIKEKWNRNNGLTILERKFAKKKISIVIPTYNHLEDCLRPCIESIKKYTDLSDIEVIIVANGCTDGTREYVYGLGVEFRLIWIEEASGYTKSTNYGIRAAQGEFILLLNNDTELLPQTKNDWIDKMLAPMADPAMGATGPLALLDPYAQERILIFFCCLIRKEVFDKVGLLDEIFHPGGGEDIDFTAKMVREGYKWLQVPDNNPLNRTHTNTGNFGIWHKDNRTFSEMSEYTMTIIKRNGLINHKRYGRSTKLKLNALDVGSDVGFLTVHPDAHPALLKMPYDKLEFEDGTVDEIIAIDLPVDAYISEWKRVIKPTGTITVETNGVRTVLNDNSPKIYDCFMFFDELDIIDIRFQTLFDVVDKFVIVESTRTHSNKPKELVFHNNKERFSKYLDKVIYVIVDDIETGEHWGSHWERERDQRNAIVRGLTECRPQDIIILSDCDEIPNPQAIKDYAGGLVHLNQKLYYYYLNCLSAVKWDKAKIFSYQLLSSVEPQKIRENLGEIPYTTYESGGWHFSYIGGSEKIKTKLQSFSHQEFNTPEITDIARIESAIKTGQGLFGRDEEAMVIVGIDNSFPKCVVENHRELTKKKLIRASLVYDCFPFFNELEVLDIRLNELDSVVDYFVLCEMPVTHKGDPKPLYFQENKQRFSKWLDRIIYVCPNTWPTDQDPWSRERFQRDACYEALGKFEDYDIIIASDVDEIPRANALTTFKGDMGIVAMEQQRFNYFLNLGFGIDEQLPGVFSKVVTGKVFRDIPGKFCQLRYSEPNHVIKDGGWHFSYQGGADYIINKLESWAHQEWNRPEFKDPEVLKKKMESGLDPLGEKPCSFIAVTYPILPKYVVENADLLEAKGLIHISTSQPEKVEVTAYISTKDRYFTTLPMAIMSVINQSYPIKKLIIFDDGEHKDLRELSPYREIFGLLTIKGIEWYFLFAGRQGQVANHNAAIEFEHSTEWLWRVDDDDSPEPDCLEKLVRNVTPEVGAVGGLVHMPSQGVIPTRLCSGKIEDIYGRLNLQWSDFKGVREVDHLHNTFIYRKSASKHGYHRGLSPVGHREETLFSYEIKRAGWKVLIDPEAKTWHMRDPNGGIRSHTLQQNYQHDEEVFSNKLSEWKVKPNQYKLFMLNSGLGDHLCFKLLLPELKNKYKGVKLLVANCYPEVFKDDDIESLSIIEGTFLESDDKHNIYRWCWERNWDGSQGNLVEAYRKMYLYEN
jgi:beta-1,4-mannosyl-glycoprotein beta-1,4-N-acetylglucosaminyltransferase